MWLLWVVGSVYFCSNSAAGGRRVMCGAPPEIESFLWKFRPMRLPLNFILGPGRRRKLNTHSNPFETHVSQETLVCGSPPEHFNFLWLQLSHVFRKDEHKLAGLMPDPFIDISSFLSLSDDALSFEDTSMQSSFIRSRMKDGKAKFCSNWSSIDGSIFRGWM